MRTLVHPSVWDRFTPQSQIDYLESFLAMLDNVTDRKSLQFWKDRQQETEISGFTFRVSLGEEELKTLNLNTIPDKDYLGIEFWKTRGENFVIRTTSGSTSSPRIFTETTPEQSNELMPLISAWYERFK